MNRHDVTQELRALSLPAGEYVVVGGGVLAMRGIRDTEDIDLVVSERLFADLQAQGWRAKTRPNGKPGLKHGLIEAYLDVNCESFERSTSWLLENAQVLDGIPTIDLETLENFKAGYGRPKDLRDLTLLRERTGIKLSTGPQSAS
jgi:hypothetical protein